MDKPDLTKRKELASILLSSLKTMNLQLDHAASEVEKGSGAFYEEAFREKQLELENVMGSYRKNVERVKEISREITETINFWYEFVKDENEMKKLIYPFLFFMKKKALYNKIKVLNAEISSIAINNRFLKEQLTVLEHQLEIKAASLARSGGDYLEYEKLLIRKKTLSDELKYLLPTIPGICPAEISTSGVDKLLALL